MDCLDCGGDVVAFRVPSEYRAHVPGEEPGVALCTRCLSLQPVADPPADPPTFDAVSTAFSDDAGIQLALMLGLLDSLALYREEIAALLEAVERAGVDPLLVLDRLAADPEIDAAVDLRGRRRQLEQLL